MMEQIANALVKKKCPQVGPTLDLLMEESSLESEGLLDFELFEIVAVTVAEVFGLLVLIICNVIGIRW